MRWAESALGPALIADVVIVSREIPQQLPARELETLSVRFDRRLQAFSAGDLSEALAGCAIKLLDRGRPLLEGAGQKLRRFLEKVLQQRYRFLCEQVLPATGGTSRFAFSAQLAGPSREAARHPLQSRALRCWRIARRT